MRPAELLAPAALLAAFGFLAVSSMARNSITGDEVTHLPAGYTYVRTGDFRLNMQHPPLIKMLAGLPLLALDLKPVEGSPGWPKGREWMFGKDFLTNNRVPMPRIVFFGRLPMVGVGLLLGALLFCWARELWGYWPAVFVLFLYATCPNFLAHTGIVHTDVGVACFSVATVYALWKLARHGRARYLLPCGVSLGLALLAKYSGAVTAGTVAALCALSFWYGAPLSPGGLARSWRERLTPRRAALWAAAGLAMALLAAAMVNDGFGFPHGLQNYAKGFTLIHADANPHWEGFLWGEYSKTGFWYYYLLAQLWKTPLPALLCVAAAVLLMPRVAAATRLDWWFVLLPAAAFHAAGMWKPASIGVRHVLPAFPFLFLAAGATAQWVGRRGSGVRVVFALLCLWQAVGTLRVYPHFIPYFNELAGGPAGGIYYLDDSNVEWGQDWYELKRYIDAQPPSPLRLLAFEPIAREHYGISADPMKLEDAVWPQPGVTYFAGAATLQRNSLFDDYPGVRFHWLERYRPVDRIGWSILVYRFSTDPADRDDPRVYFIPRQRWYTDALTELRGIAQRHPGFDYPRAVLAQVYADRGAWREQTGDAAGALRDDLDAVLVAPDPAPHRAAFRAAVPRLLPAIAPAEGPLDVAFQEAGFRCRAQQDADCLLALLRVLRREPAHIWARLNLGSIYAQLGFPGLARGEWEECLRIDPAFAAARQNLSRLGGAAPPPEARAR